MRWMSAPIPSPARRRPPSRHASRCPSFRRPQMQGTEPITMHYKSRAGTRVSRERLLEVIASVGKVITVSGSLQAVMDVVAEECARLTRADGATIFMMENQRLTAKSAVGTLGFA